MNALQRRIAVGVFLALSMPVYARAQSNGFLFKQPRFSVSLRGGLAVPRAQSDVFTFTSEQLTVDRGDFKSFAMGIDLGMRVVDWTHLILSIDNSRAFHRSEFRDYIDNEDLPIEQATKFARLNFSLGIKQYVMSPGRAIGKFAWVPTRLAPFVGAGAGAMRYTFHQYGDFVDFDDLDVFSAQFESTGWTGTAHARAGVDYSLGSFAALTAQGRYDWAKAATLSRDFLGFDRIDLTGFSTTVGFTIRF